MAIRYSLINFTQDKNATQPKIMAVKVGKKPEICNFGYFTLLFFHIMYLGKKIAIVLPAYNAEATLERTFGEIPLDMVDELVLVDDASTDKTLQIAQKLGIKHVISHETNKGYGGNQKSCYRKAVELEADIIIMLHPDYQYTPKLITSMVNLIAQDLYSVVLGSRILGKGAIKGGMPRYKYVANRFLTLFQNLCVNQKLSEYHTGYRAYSREVLLSINYEANSDDFVFDNQVLLQIFSKGFSIGEISCPTKYFPEASSINLYKSLQYGLGVIMETIYYLLHKSGWRKSELYL